jgi:hypothetical protein
VAWGVVSAVSAAAVILVVTAAPVDVPTPPSAEIEQEAFELIAGQEAELRTAAAKSFPGDPWSQDDEFHHAERGRARWFSDRRGVSLAHVMRAIDDGLHGRWPKPQGARVVPGIQPCRPRLDY